MISAFELFRIGIGPSSSHTVGPMRAARRFAEALAAAGRLDAAASVRVDLHGSLGATGRGHGTPQAVLLGLEGAEPETVDPEAMGARVAEIRASARLRLLGRREIRFAEAEHLTLHIRRLPFHPNGLRFAAFAADGAELAQRTSYSIGGGFVVDEGAEAPAAPPAPEPFPFASAAELLAHDRAIADLVLANEAAHRPEAEVRRRLLEIWAVMQECVARGCRRDGELPGGLHVRRRAPALHRALLARADTDDPLRAMEWVTLWAMAVNEENAAGGRVVTAPTNGAAGIVPAVLHYYRDCVPGADDDGVVRFLLAAAAIGSLCKRNASISGADVGCQGEVGSACAMAAAGLAEVLGGTPAQVENAAEIGMEHNLGLTCDPIGGLVQVPCIERNALAAVQAIGAARMALHGDGRHLVSLDAVIKTMRDTGADMKDEYKETARGGLAVNVVAC